MTDPEASAVGRTGVVPAGRVVIPERHRFASAGHGLLVGLLCFSLWLAFDARQLYNSANASPLGVRRSVAMSILRPIARVEELFGFDRVVNGGNRALGRTSFATPGGAVTPPVSLPLVSTARHHKKGSGGTKPAGPPPLTSPTVARPITIMDIGDSIGEDLGYGVAEEIGSDPRVHMLQNSVGDTGISNIAYYDWPAAFERELAQSHPQIVIAMFGANDWQGLIANGQPVQPGTHAWIVAYTARVAEMMSEATAAGVHLIWVGLPIMQSPSFAADMKVLNSIFLHEARLHPGVFFAPTWKLFSTASGQYAEYLPDRSGNLIEVRDPDGVHIDPPGGTDLIGAYVVHRIEGVWHITL
ncbi:MAG TPA: DUF459 domain-containing protein [Acidimicrobiales bacterium]|nr:DUF459 domain-containing protein [Acidimicrobiales bacterium]